MLLHSQFDLHHSNLKPRAKGYSIRLKNHETDISGYDLKQTIGEGGFGKVKKAIHKITGEVVAVKIFSTKNLDVGQLRNIQREIEVQKNLMHENIAQIYEVYRSQSQIFIFMEYCPNGELFEYINKNGALSEKQAGRIFNQILSAVRYLKDNKLCHRDIKAENILFDQQWNVKLIDFGFSCLYRNQDMRRTVCGTPAYTPPEMVKHLSYKPQLVDVWCLGVTLYAMLAAQLPFEAKTKENRKFNIINCEYQILEHFSEKVSKLFSKIFVHQMYRANLSDLELSEFCLSSKPCTAKYVNFMQQNLVVDEKIVDYISTNYNCNISLLIESVNNCKLNKYHSLYYLTLKKLQQLQKKQGNSPIQFSKKQKRSSMIKLIPINDTPPLAKKQPEIDLLLLKKNKVQIAAKSNGNTLDMAKCRLRRSNSPDSPRRLLDCIKAYKNTQEN